ncbi:lipase chaperone [Aestuariicella sp. G3-2]|uniref:lipase chaperone n=1 Tax=Pseudomaricurvus albidus TaxID=2842452 RepID=UPI001C0CDF39|nr:lipase chaperone [Aestuariicella albida]
MKNKKTIAVVLGCVAVVAAAFAGAVLLAEMQTVTVDASSVVVADPKAREVRYQIVNQNTGKNISTSSQSGDDADAGTHAGSEVLSGQSASGLAMFDAEGIFEATQKVRVDDSGNVILDHEAMLALNEALGQQGLELDTLSLAQLKDLIQVAMPGKAGSQVALVVGNYYEYLKAKEEFENLHQDNHLNQDYEQRQASIQALRESYLGAEVSEKLFAQSDAESEFMRASFELASNKELTAEERQTKKATIQNRYVNSVVEANGWQDRYKQFVAEKNKLLEESGGDNLSEDQKEKVITLWSSYFSEGEREKMEALQVPVL